MKVSVKVEMDVAWVQYLHDLNTQTLQPYRLLQQRAHNLLAQHSM